MIFNDMLSKLYLKVYISVVVSNSDTVVCVQILKDKRVIERVSKAFDTNVGADKLIEFIKGYRDESVFYYIAFLDYSKEQGALLDCKEANNLNKISSIKYLCNGSWSTFTNKNALINMQNRYAAFGIDFIFSPFTVLANFFANKISKDEAALYVLFQQDSVTVTIFCRGELLYADYVSMDIVIEDDLSAEEDELGLDDGMVDLENIDLEHDLDDFDDLEDLEDLENLDSLESLDDLDEFVEPEQDSASKSSEADSVDDISRLSQDYKRFLILQNAIHNFYTDKQYQSVFLEVAYIAAFHAVDSELKQYLEEELFLKAHVREIDLCQEVITLAMKEKI